MSMVETLVKRRCPHSGCLGWTRRRHVLDREGRPFRAVYSTEEAGCDRDDCPQKDVRLVRSEVHAL